MCLGTFGDTAEVLRKGNVHPPRLTEVDSLQLLQHDYISPTPQPKTP